MRPSLVRTDVMKMTDRCKEALTEAGQYRLLLDAITDHAIFMLDESGRVTSWNGGAQRLKGYTEAEILGRHVSLFYTQEDMARDKPDQALQTAAKEGCFVEEGWRVRKDGSVFLASVVLTAIHDGGGALVGYVKVTHDATAARKAQRDSERAQEALFQSQKMDAMGQLTGGVAHDFNNILMAILGGLEVVHRRLAEDPKITPLLTNAIRAAQRGRLLTQRMLAFARCQELKPETIDLAALVHGMKDFLQQALGPAIGIEVRFPATLSAVHADPNQLELVLLDLAINARDAMPDGGCIVIAGKEETVLSGQNGLADFGRYVCLSLADVGEGMDETTLTRATEPFFTARSGGRGTGLGLSVAHGFAEQSGGHFILRSRLGEGTVAELWLPVASVPADLALGAADGYGAFGHHGTLSSTRPLVVLVVDDDRLVLMNTTTMLNGLGHRVFTAISGQQALGLLRRETMIDLVIIDHGMPEMSGAELAEAIRMDWPSLPIIFATPLTDGAVQELPKPLRQSEPAQAIAQTTL